MNQLDLRAYLPASNQQQPMAKNGSHPLILPPQQLTIPRISVHLGILLFPRLNLAAKQKKICERPLPGNSRMKAVVKSVPQNLTELWMRLGRIYNNGKHLGKQHRHLIQSTWSSQVRQTIVALTYQRRLAPNLAHHIPNTSTRDKWRQKGCRRVEMNSLGTSMATTISVISCLGQSVHTTGLGGNEPCLHFGRHQLPRAALVHRGFGRSRGNRGQSRMG